MRFIPLIWSGLWRNPGRTILIFLQVGVALSLFGMLQGLKTGIEHAILEARADVLIVHSSLGLGDSLPLSYLEQIKAVPGLKVVDPVELFMAAYQNPSQRIGVVAVNPADGWLSAFTFQVTPEFAAAFQKTRTGALVMEKPAKQYGWKLGDHLPLLSQTAQVGGSTDWAFDIVGFYSDTDLNGGTDNILIHYDYFDAARAIGKGTVAHFNVAAADPAAAASVADAIDRRFANSSNETRTESLRELGQSELQAIGDLNFLIRAVIGAVLVALLFATATMMMQSIRERRPELAILKTLGFTDLAVFMLICAEAILICIAGAAFGLALATLVFPLTSQFVQGLTMPMVVVEVGLAVAVLVALVSATLPALFAARLQVVDALSVR